MQPHRNPSSPSSSGEGNPLSNGGPSGAASLTCPCCHLWGSFTCPLWGPSTRSWWDAGNQCWHPKKLHLTPTSLVLPWLQWGSSPWQSKCHELKPRLGVGVMCSHPMSPPNILGQQLLALQVLGGAVALPATPTPLLSLSWVIRQGVLRDPE